MEWISRGVTVERFERRKGTSFAPILVVTPDRVFIYSLIGGDHKINKNGVTGLMFFWSGFIYLFVFTVFGYDKSVMLSDSGKELF